LKDSLALVTAALDLKRTDRDFETHYVQSLKKLIQTPLPVIVYAPKKHWNKLLEVNSNLILRNLDISDLEQHQCFSRIQTLVNQPSWYQQTAWMENSVVRSAHYITLTLMKLSLLKSATTMLPADRYIWLDSGVFSSYGVSGTGADFDFTKMPSSKFFITSYPYCSSTEIHGFNIRTLELLAEHSHSYVSRATVFSASAAELDVVSQLFDQTLTQALSAGAIGTEEAVFTILCLKRPDLFTRYAMNSGDIGEFLNTLK
jgi:hypothetical protein